MKHAQLYHCIGRGGAVGKLLVVGGGRMLFDYCGMCAGTCWYVCVLWSLTERKLVKSVPGNDYGYR